MKRGKRTLDDLEIFNMKSYYNNTGESDADFYDEVDFLSGVDDIDNYEQPIKEKQENTTDGLDFLDHVDFLDGVQDELDYFDKQDEKDKRPEKVVKTATPKQKVKSKPVPKRTVRKEKVSKAERFKHYLNVCCIVGTLCLIIIILIFSWKLFGPEKSSSVASTKSNGIWPYEVSAKELSTTAKKSNSKVAQSITKQKVLFIGNSRTLGLQLSGALSNATYFARQGMNVTTSLTQKMKVKGQMMSLVQVLKKYKYDRVYIMLGTNELGWPYTYKFEDGYIQLINKIRKIQPKTKVYLQSILPVTSDKSKSDKIFNNKRINKFNKSVKKVAKKTSATYLDVGSSLAKKDGSLPKKASSDGIHLKQDFCFKWANYLKKMN